MLEKDVENALKAEVKAAGGMCLKWVSPGHRGVPDRIVLFPHGVIAFVELKQPGVTVSAGGLQEWWRCKLHDLGFACFVINTQKDAHELAVTLSDRSRRCADI